MISSHGMQYRGRALYNLRSINHREDPTVGYPSWQVYDYRVMTKKALFSELKIKGISLKEEKFLLLAKEVESPEELAEKLECKLEESREHVYLLIFELWRRLLPERETLSIFCDELDHAIDQFEKDEPLSEEHLQQLIEELEDILDLAADKELVSPEKIFDTVQQFCCHTLELFLTDFISFQIDKGNEIYASELLENLYSYFRNKRPLDLQRIRLVYSSDPEEGEAMVSRFIEGIEEEFDSDIGFELVHYLTYGGPIQYLSKAVRIVCEKITTIDEAVQLLGLTLEHLHIQDRVQEIVQISRGIEQIEALDPQSEIRPQLRQEMKDLLLPLFSFSST